MQTQLHLGAVLSSIVLGAWIVPGIRVRNLPAAVAVAILFSALNFLLGWAIKQFLLMLGVLTLGMLFVFVPLFLFTPLVVNAALLWATDKTLRVFDIEDAKALWLMALLVSAVNWVFHFLVRLR